MASRKASQIRACALPALQPTWLLGSHKNTHRHTHTDTHTRRYHNLVAEVSQGLVVATGVVSNNKNSLTDSIPKPLRALRVYNVGGFNPVDHEHIDPDPRTLKP